VGGRVRSEQQQRSAAKPSLVQLMDACPQNGETDRAPGHNRRARNTSPLRRSLRIGQPQEMRLRRPRHPTHDQTRRRWEAKKLSGGHQVGSRGMNGEGGLGRGPSHGAANVTNKHNARANGCSTLTAGVDASVRVSEVKCCEVSPIHHRALYATNATLWNLRRELVQPLGLSTSSRKTTAKINPPFFWNETRFAHA